MNLQSQIANLIEKQRSVELTVLRTRGSRWVEANSVQMLRMSLGLVFFAFGVLKFFPEMSPAEELAIRTVDRLTFGIISGNTALFLVAAMETTIGVCLITGKWLRLGLGLLLMTVIGIMAPLALFPGELFSRQYHAPTLTAQYVFKDIALAGAALVLIGHEMRKRRAILSALEQSQKSPSA
jgi:uncharacterized membrane protein YphA (DoxX/SURF4 family)